MKNRDLSQWKLRFSQPDEKYAGASESSVPFVYKY